VFFYSYHLVFYDQRGSLRSPCPDSTISVARHVADLERLRAELRLERVTLVGHSMGTTLAMAYLDRHPRRVRGLVLASASLPRYPLGTLADSAFLERHERAKQAFFARPAVAAELRRRGLDRDTSRLSDEQRTARWRVEFAAANIYHLDRWPQVKGGQVFWNRRAAAAAARTMPSTFDYTPALRAHPCPVWIIEGDHDFGPLTVELHRRWTAGLPRVRLVVVRDAGHNAWIDAPSAFRARLSDALESTTSCRAAASPGT